GQTLFQGWYTGNGSGGDWGNRFTSASQVTADMTVYAKWGAAAPTTCTVTFDSQDGSSPLSVTVNSGDTLGTLLQPAKAGNTFGGWFMAVNGGGTQFTGSTPVTDDITLYAKWIVTQYTVTFDSQGGSTVPNTTVNHGSSLGSSFPAAPAKTGNTFGGWFTQANGGGTAFTGTTPVMGNITVYAKWTAQSSGGEYNLVWGIFNSSFSQAESIILSQKWTVEKTDGGTAAGAKGAEATKIYNWCLANVQFTDGGTEQGSFEEIVNLSIDGVSAPRGLKNWANYNKDNVPLAGIFDGGSFVVLFYITK
ncbi:MAG: InlB B-repeat-containing protein, partial [Treponema sp.]|nr:InlB B-repeat-containing protein [Treponema sp.]